MEQHNEHDYHGEHPLLLSRLTAVLSLCVLAACGLAPQRPAPPVFDAESAFSRDFAEADEASPGAGAWWSNAVAGELLSSLNRAIENSPRTRRAAAEIDAAQAVVRQAGADRGPTLSAGADAGVQKTSSQSRTSSHSVGVDGNLPLDVGGTLEARELAAQHALGAARADATQMRSDLARDLLLAAIDGAEATQRHALLVNQRRLAEKLLRLIELRFTQGLASSVDVLQQRDQLAALRQQLPLAELDAHRAAGRLRELSGITPDRDSELIRGRLPAVRASFTPAKPVDLLQRRADLRAGRARLEAADARFAAALADRWPQLSLSAGVLSRAVSGDVSTLVSAAIDATLTLFDGGGKVAVADERRAQLLAAGEQLLEDWFAAVIAVDTLLHTQASLEQRIALSDQRLTTAEALLAATQRRYERGISDYLPVLEALRGLQQQQRDHLALQAELANTRVRLHHALGSSSDGGTG